MSLFASSAADVTLERVEELIEQDPPESLTLEFKEKYSPGVVKSIAAMANTFGGLILIGVTDQPGPNRLVGVPDTAVAQVVNARHESLEPPWQPEIIPVPLAESPGFYIVVIRVDSGRAPRPPLMSGVAPSPCRAATPQRTALAWANCSASRQPRCPPAAARSARRTCRQTATVRLQPTS